MRLNLQMVLVVSIILISLSNTYSQTISFGFQTGIGIYNMPNLESINETVHYGLPFTNEIVTSFPTYLNYRPILKVNFRRFNLGLSYLYQSTGSRVSSSDYSANYRFDMLLSSKCPSLNLEVLLSTHEKYKFFSYAYLGTLNSKLKINEKFVINNVTATNQLLNLQSQNYFIEFGALVDFDIYKSISLGVSGGYFLTFGDQAYYLDDNKDQILYSDENHEPIRPEWNGFRIGLTVFYNFGPKNSSAVVINNQEQ